LGTNTLIVTANTNHFFRRLKKVKFLFIDGVELLTKEAAHKLSDFMNLHKGLANQPPCGVCGMKLLFGGAMVVQIAGQRTKCLLDNWYKGESPIRTALYPFFGVPTHKDLPPPYTAPATDSEAYDKFKDIEMQGEIFLKYFATLHSRHLYAHYHSIYNLLPFSTPATK
jgi:hypothetical protein